MLAQVNVSSTPLPNDTVDWDFGIGYWGIGAEEAQHTRAGVGTTGLGDVEAGESGREVRMGGAGP